MASFRLCIFGLSLLLALPLSAQLGPDPDLKSKTPAPRWTDGHPDLGNGRGSWYPSIIDDMSGMGGGSKNDATRARQSKMVDKIQEVPFLPWAKKLYEVRDQSLSNDDPEGFCLPPGIPRMMNTPFPMQIYQLPDRILQLYEGGAHMWRVIWMDGREHPKGDQLNLTYLGYSVGHWEGDTLVVDVRGFNERTWLDAAGHPHTDQLRVIERYTRESEKVLHYEATIEDPGAYTKPWTVGWRVAWVEGVQPDEYVCQENNKDVGVGGHMVGALPGEKRP